MLSVRPKLAEMAFQLYGRTLHPELFDVHQSRQIERGPYTARLDITSAGHVVTWRKDGMTLTEVCASAESPLPQKRRLMSYRLRGERHDRMECRGGIVYQMNFQLELASREVFWNLQQELSRCGDHSGLVHEFNANGRMALGAISYLHVETRSRTLLVQAFHTFPDDLAIVKTQSTFELPGA